MPRHPGCPPRCECEEACAVEEAIAETKEDAAVEYMTLLSYARTLAVHVEGHFAMPTESSREICKNWARTVLDHKPAE